MISFVVPAHNEEALIGGTLDALAAAVAQLRIPVDGFEIIVADDDSSDGTAAIAAGRGARVVSIKRRQIAAARNAGAAAARGSLFIFVDADTIVPAETLRETIAAVDAGAAAGGAAAALDAPAQRWAKLSWMPFQYGARLLRLPGGAYMFTTRAAFEAAGGFDERYFAGEEIHFARALKRVGSFVVVRSLVTTSGRKFRLLGFRGMCREWMRLAIRGPRVLHDRKHLGLWYDKHRD